MINPAIPPHSQPPVILIPWRSGMVAVACTIMIHALAVGAIVSFVRHERRLGRAGASFWIDVAIVSAAIAFAFAAHLVEILLWSVLFMMCGEFTEFSSAFDHSAVHYTTLGYGDVVMTPSWRLLGPLEAADGMLMFGVSTAVIFAVIQRLLLMRFVDLRD
jgi:hypothetical protein